MVHAEPGDLYIARKAPVGQVGFLRVIGASAAALTCVFTADFASFTSIKSLYA
jgi:hypothetical protein